MERAFLIVAHLPTGSWSAEDETRELGALVESAGAVVAGSAVQRRSRLDAATLVGRGKAREVREIMDQIGADLAVVNGELTPGQARNLEDALGRPVIDRTQVVLDIFAQRARTREGRLQVELAQLRYLLPRLAGVGRSLSRLGGGIGTRGPGETKLEADRRRLRERIRAVEREIEEVRRQRAVMRAGRRRLGLPLVALVGYTNAGKSTLFNALTGSEAYARDELFATLDPTLRRAGLGDGREVLLSDTVGFIHNLPHHLVAAFRATLEEVAGADLLLHVLDVSREGWDLRLSAVEEVLADLGATRQPRVLALNQADRLPEGRLPPGLPPGVAVSAVARTGLEELRQAIDRALGERGRRHEWFIPYTEADLLGWLRHRGHVEGETYQAGGVLVIVHCDAATARRVEERLAAAGTSAPEPAAGSPGVRPGEAGEVN